MGRLRMAQLLAHIIIHVVFSTKNREPTIAADVMSRLHAYLAGVCRNQDSEAFRVGGTADHVHIACSLPRTDSVSRLVQEIKASSSSWMKTIDGGHRRFAWQAGYGAFSVGQSQLPALVRYIDGQGEHHRVKTFQEEFTEFLQRYRVASDERYVWE